MTRSEPATQSWAVPGLFLLALFLLSGTSFAQQAEYPLLKQQAETFFQQKSFSKSHQAYQKARNLSLSPEEKRWVEFRLADTRWRSESATQKADTSVLEQAHNNLNKMVRDVTHPEDQDRLWAEIHESLGDYGWLRSKTRNWGSAKQHYRKALDWWAGAKDIDLARHRYLNIVWNMTSPPGRPDHYHYGYYGNYVSVDILENASKIARSPKDRSRAHYWLAMALRQQGQMNQQQKVSESFEIAIRNGEKDEWYDDALYHYAEWLVGQGEVVITKDGQQRREKNFTKGLKLFRKLVRDFKKGETRYFNQAKNRIKRITQPTLSLSVSSFFLPQSQIEIQMNWRNVKDVALALYSIDLANDVDLGRNVNVSNWKKQVNLMLKTKHLSWSETTEDRGDHKPGRKILKLDKPLPLGAYMLRATGGGQETRELILVTDAAVVLKTSGKQALVYFSDASSGAPLANAPVQLQERYYTGRNWVWRRHDLRTDKDGLAHFPLKEGRHNSELFVAANRDNRQAFLTSYSYRSSSRNQSWKIYVHTDRPAYRPNETTQWKLTARTYNGSEYSTPARQKVEYRISDPRGAKLKEGTLTLNEFGSAWDSLELSEKIPLGAYQIAFWTPKRKKHLGSATLFRLEEYKLPEFKVHVTTPEKNGKKATYQLGDKVTVDIAAEYYFGGPVANASVEVVVHQKPFHHFWRPQPDYPWYYEDLHRNPQPYWGRGQQIQRETLKTDAQGRAHLTFDTRRGNQDLEFHIEARVTDASRREIVARDSVRVTRQSHYVYLNPAHSLYRPQDKITIDVKSLDANSQPITAEGTVKITRDFWFEIWLDPQGREVKGRELDNLRRKSTIFPPSPVPGYPGWKLKFRGYQHDEIATRLVKTDADGKAEISFSAEREGYYRFAWTSHTDSKSLPVKTETTVWVATNATTDLGYRHGGLEIIADKDTFRAGQKAPVMLVAPTNDRYVLFSIEGDDLLSYQLVHMTGSVKLLELDIREKHAPNIFLNAVMVSDRQIFRANKQVIVPPVKNFLNVSVTSDRDLYQPREEGVFTVTTRDHNNQPVSAEVALGLVDEAVYAIQEDLAGDPRKFFYGSKRTQRTRTTSSFQMKRYDRKPYPAKPASLGGEKHDQFGSFDDKNGGGRISRSNASGDFLEEAEMAMELPLTDRLEAKSSFKKEVRSKAPLADEPSVQVRSDFRTTVLWNPKVMTGKDGKTTVKVKFPDSLTQWRATARTVTRRNQFGFQTAKVRTQNPLIVRLQAPRFFVVGDRVTLSAVINNNTETPMTVRPYIDTQGLTISGIIKNGRATKAKLGSVTVPPNGEQRVDWLAVVQQPGPVKIQVGAKASLHADAMEKSFIAHEHGIEKFLARSGKMHGDSVLVKLNIPRERKKDTTRFSVQVTPSLAVTMLDALPYLIDFPYGCTEQTLSRFLPTIITLKTLKGLGLPPEEVMDRLFGGIHPEHTSKTHRKGKRNFQELNAMVRQGLERLYDFQHSDGGWGWWKKGDSDPFMTAYVLWGLTLAGSAEVEVNRDVLTRAHRFLDKVLVEAEVQYDLQAWLLHATAFYHHTQKTRKISKFQARAFDNLWNHRQRMNAYSLALLTLSAHYYGNDQRARILVDNLENGVVRDNTPDTSIVQRGSQQSHSDVMATAHWGEDGIFYRWSEGGVEATATVLRALLAVNPKHPLIEPATHWLVKNRRGAHWSNTRDTAMTILTLNDYLQFSGELEADQEYTLWVNGRRISNTRVRNILQAPTRYNIAPESIRDGENLIKIIRKAGKGSLYFSAEAQFFSREEPIPPAGNELFVRRQYYKLVGRPTLLKGYIYERVPLNDGGEVTSGERIETVLTIEAKNNYGYLVFEDLKPAGFEAVQIKSGQPVYARQLKSSAIPRKLARQESARRTTQIMTPDQKSGNNSNYTGRSRWVYQELRDRNVALFIDKLPEGIWEISYTMRAEVPGKFHALPLTGHAMYIPEIRANGAETRVEVKDRLP